MENPIPAVNNSRFGLGSVLTIAALVGLLGFGFGANFDQLSQSFTDLETENQQLPEDLNYDSVERVYDLLRKNYAGELSETELIEGMKSGLVAASGDPFSEYLNQAAANELEQSLQGEFSGIGAEIGIRQEQLVVIAPLDGTPAAQAGLRAGDMIVGIDGEDTTRMSVHDAVVKIRGEEGTEVVLTIARSGQSLEEITLTRAVIEIPSVESELLEGDVAYIELVRFGEDSADRFREAAHKMKAAGAESIILDVRNNPGGYLDVAVAITSEFLTAGTVVVEERRGEKVIATERAQSGGVLIGMPTVVLVNGGSASASEIIAGALQDQGVATVIGEQTFGKGSVQQLLQIGGGDILRVTIANWYTPEGENINKEGITPDEEVELTSEDFEAENDPQLDRALEILLES
ncbi:MAG: S41 family peptidase [Candidatus Saccharimonadales bacterium]